MDTLRANRPLVLSSTSHYAPLITSSDINPARLRNRCLLPHRLAVRTAIADRLGYLTDSRPVTHEFRMPADKRINRGKFFSVRTLEVLASSFDLGN